MSTTVTFFKNMVVKMHVDAENDASEDAKSTRKLTPSMLDNFTNLTKNKLKVRVKSGVSLIKYLNEKSDTENSEFELKYALKRLIRGLGSTTINARAGFYSTLVALLVSNPEVTLEQLFSVVNAELQTSGSNSKSEKGEIYTGQVLTCGAIIRSGLFLKGTAEEQSKVLQILVNAGNRRSYLASPAFKILIDLFERVDEKQFRNVILPPITVEVIKPFEQLNMDNLYLLLIMHKKFPGVLNKKFMENHIGTPEIISERNLRHLCDVLISTVVISLKHPVYEEFAKAVASSQLLIPFITEMDISLTRPNRNKQILATVILKYICDNLSDPSLLPDLLSRNFIQQTLGYFQMLKGKQKDDEYQQKAHELFNSILNLLKKEDTKSKTKIEALEKLLFWPGTFIFEKITRSKLAQQITALLDAEGVKKLAALYQEVVLAEKLKANTNDTWWNKDRVYAAQLLVKLLSHPSIQTEREWRTEQLKFLLNLTIINNNRYLNVGTTLAASLKETFYRALDLKLPKLEDLRQLLSHLVHHIDSVLAPDNLENVLRVPITSETYDIWKQTVELINKLEKKEQKKKKSERAVFHVLFLHMALQLFNDVKLATDSLKELFICYERIKTKKDEENENSEDPLWIEVVVDLFLNLLSHNSHLLRSVINCVFPHLCTFINATALHQILSILDSKNADNPLSKEDSEVESEDSGDDSAEEDTEEEEEEDEEEEETVNDKLRMAVREALGTNGYQTDEESVDVDNIGEEEGQKLDEALAEAFKQFKPNRRGKKNAKQSEEEKALTHFRVRVLDLLEIFLDNNPAMDLTLETIPPLLETLEFCVHDEHQKPLQDRVRSCLKKLTNLKKFRSTENVDDSILTQLLQSLLDKSTKSASILQDMGDKIAECCIFVISCSQVLRTVENTPKKIKKHLKKAVEEIVLNELQMYFKKRDSLTPYALFNNVMQLQWDRTVKFVPVLIEFSFSNEIRPFRRNQALQLLKLFYTNNRLLTTHAESFSGKLEACHADLSSKTVNLLQNFETNKVKEKFVNSLFGLLIAVKRSPLRQDGIVNWTEIGECVRKYRSQVTLSKDGRKAYTNLCTALGIPSAVQVVKKQVKNKQIDDTKSEESEKSKKEDKKRKKLKTKSNEKNKLKKEAKLLRLQSSSEGFLNDVSFGGVNLGNGFNHESNSQLTDEENSTTDKKRKQKITANEDTHNKKLKQ